MRPVLVALFVAAALALPTEMMNERDDPEFKPLPAAPSAPEGDEYTVLHSEWHEPKAEVPKKFIPQTGALLSMQEDVISVSVALPESRPGRSVPIPHDLMTS